MSRARTWATRPGDREVARMLGQRVRAYRYASGLTQHQLGALLGAEQPWVSDLERGRMIPCTERLVILGDLLGLSVGELAGGER